MTEPNKLRRMIVLCYSISRDPSQSIAKAGGSPSWCWSTQVVARPRMSPKGLVVGPVGDAAKAQIPARRDAPCILAG